MKIKKIAVVVTCLSLAFASNVAFAHGHHGNCHNNYNYNYDYDYDYDYGYGCHAGHNNCINNNYDCSNHPDMHILMACAHITALTHLTSITRQQLLKRYRQGLIKQATNVAK